MKTKTVVIIGHSEIGNIKKSDIEEQLEKLINQGFLYFLCGGMGQFDILCAECINNLKQKYPVIKCLLVIPYLTTSLKNNNYYDEIIYPEGFENYYYKSAIIQRNRYMVDNSSLAFCYICYTFGGAIKTYNYAIKQGLIIINTGTIK